MALEAASALSLAAASSLTAALQQPPPDMGDDAANDSGASDLSAELLSEESLAPLAVTHSVRAAEEAVAVSSGAEASAAAAAALANQFFPSRAGSPKGFDVVTSLVLTVNSLARVSPKLCAPLAGVSPLLSFQFPAAASGSFKPVVGVLRCSSPLSPDSEVSFDAWAKAPGAGQSFGTTTSAYTTPLRIHPPHPFLPSNAHTHTL